MTTQCGAEGPHYDIRDFLTPGRLMEDPINLQL